MATLTLVGTETEYAITALDERGGLLPLDGILRSFQEHAARRPSMSGNESGVFLSNGSRFYVDGSHPEYASAEASSPWDVVRLALAGDRLMAQLAQEVSEADHGIASLVVRKGNVDYMSDTTWGNHENYLHRCPSARLRHELIPHLVSRTVLTGSGGFELADGTTPRFVLSPRARFIRRVVDPSAPGAIALVDDRTQPHCKGFLRQHLMCGDANQSHLSMFVRFGATALVLALIDAGHADDDAVRLADPLAALSVVSRDVTLRQEIALASGGTMTALQIQRHYLTRALAHSASLPEWAPRFCELWEDTLNRLERGADAVLDRLDWAIKLSAFRERARAAGRCWPDGPLSGVAVPDHTEQAASWRAELCESDYRYGQIFPPGLFDALDRSGTLRHQLPGIDDIDGALVTAPLEGRARIRGAVVMRLAGRTDLSVCAWDYVRDVTGARELDLSNPFTDREVWRTIVPEEETADALVARLLRLVIVSPEPDRAAARDLAARLAAPRGQAPANRSTHHAVELNNRGFDLRNAGRLEDAELLMRCALAIDLAERHPRHVKISHRRNNVGTLLLMQGRIAEARELVTAAWPRSTDRFDVTSARVLTTRLTIAFIERAPYHFFLGQLKSHLSTQPLPNFGDVDRFWQMHTVLDAVAQRLDGDTVTLLSAIVNVVNGRSTLETLEQIPLWRDTPAQPLDAAWPSCGVEVS
jgi:hypothetical protein